MDADLLKLLIQAGSFGVVVGVIVWMFTRFIPKMQDEAKAAASQNAAAVAATNAAFLAVLNESRADFRDEMRLEREAHHAEVTSVKDIVEKSVDRLEAAIMRKAG